MTVDQRQLVQLLIKTKSFKSSPTPIFPLASGAMSSFYVDCRTGLSFPEFRQMVGGMMLALVDRPVDAVGGLLVAAYPISIALSDAAYSRSGEVIRVFFIRKEPKAHGMKKQVEGEVNKGDRVVIVDDVITSGKSTVEAIQRSREAGLVVTQALVIIDREEQGGKARIEERGVKVDALCTLRDIQELSGAPSATGG